MSSTPRTRAHDRGAGRAAHGRAAVSGGPGRHQPDARRARLLRRAVPTAVVAGLAFAIGAAVGASGGGDGEQAVGAYARAWSRGDWATMHAQLTTAAKARIAVLAFAQANRDALATATAGEDGVEAGTPVKRGDAGWRVPVTVRTRSFGTVKAYVLVPVEKDGDDVKVAWAPRLVFPGLSDATTLTRETTMPARGSILARDGTPLARGPGRASAIADVAGQVVGRLDAIPPERAQELEALGVPPDAKVGVSGLERIFDARLGGVPSGVLKAGATVLGRGSGRPGRDVRTTIDPVLERVTTAALGGRYGGVVALNPRTGEIYSFAGVPFSILQPPGSTFKIVTTAGALDAGVVKTTDTFPYESRAVLSGVPLANAGGEVCGGSLAQAFAISCNSVFAPLGARLGATALVRTAERFGFNREPPFPGVAQSTIPQPGEIGDDLAIGSSAIGQGRVQATTLQMAVAAATIANGGRRPRLTLDLDGARRARARGTALGERAIRARTARRLRELMLGVVRYGTGTAAQISGVPVAGKTGTAELKSREPGDTTTNPEDTDAWFVAFAPAGRGRRARAVVGVMLVGAGAGGDTAAPVAREILAATLRRR